MELTNRLYCNKPVVLKKYYDHTVQTLKDIGYHQLFFVDGCENYLMVHHNYIMTTNADRIPSDAINCGTDVRKFFKEVTQ